MTNERAIELLHRISDSQFDGIHGDERREALDMAVRALSGDGDLISRKMAIDAILRNQEVYSNNFGNDPIDKYTIAIIDNDAQTIAQLPSAQPEQKNQKTALSVQVKVDFDDMKALLEDIGNLQTYKLSEGDDMVLADIEDIECILAKHVKAKEVQPERKRGRWIPCSERLPEHRLYVLVTYKYEYGLIDNGITWYSETENKWNTSREVLAWMPLPKPYGGESDV